MHPDQTKFFKTDILNVFLRLKESRARAALAEETGIGEGSVRTILGLLKGRGLLQSSRKGHSLTLLGAEWYAKLSHKAILQNQPSVQGFEAYSIAGMHLRQPLKALPSYQLRDAAVRHGALGTMIFSFTSGKLVLPPSKSVDYGRDYSVLIEGKRPKEGDMFIFVWSENNLYWTCFFWTGAICWFVL